VETPPAGDVGASADAYHQGSRAWQDEFDKRRLADRLAWTRHTAISGDQRAFIERCDMFVIATADEEGRPTCSYKGGEPGFVRVVDDETVAFPSYDGNGMYLTLGNASINPNVGLLFIDFEDRRRLRVNGVASVNRDDPLLQEYPEAQLVVRVHVSEVFPNCPRYIHQYRLVERSRFVPTADAETPAPLWKTEEVEPNELPVGDPALDPQREIIWRG
jgi:predicted pyridoxine 5'-phosphate oxidase superfamily flavin-nucleotide-binding protein